MVSNGPSRKTGAENETSRRHGGGEKTDRTITGRFSVRCKRPRGLSEQNQCRQTPWAPIPQADPCGQIPASTAALQGGKGSARMEPIAEGGPYRQPPTEPYTEGPTSQKPKPSRFPETGFIPEQQDLPQQRSSRLRGNLGSSELAPKLKCFQGIVSGADFL